MTIDDQGILDAYANCPNQNELARTLGIPRRRITKVLHAHNLSEHPPRTPQMLERAVEIWHQTHNTQKVADYLGLGRAHASAVLTQQGLDLPHGNAKAKIDLPMDEVAARYQAGESCSQLGLCYGVPGERIRRRLEKHGTERRPSRIAVPSGKDNYQYKDGKGYDRVVHYFRRQSYEVAAICLGYPVPQGYVIHHLDENKENNDPANLILFPSQKIHALFHQKVIRLQRAGQPVDAILIALEMHGQRLPPPPHPLLFLRDIDQPGLSETTA